MNQRSARMALILLNILSFPLFVYAIYEFASNYSAITHHEKLIHMDSGTYYLLLTSIFWLLPIIEYIGLRNDQGRKWVDKYAGAIVIFWFIVMLILANFLPYILHSKAINSGYLQCKDPREVNRTARGSSYIYSLNGCNSVNARS